MDKVIVAVEVVTEEWVSGSAPSPTSSEGGGLGEVPLTPDQSRVVLLSKSVPATVNVQKCFYFGRCFKRLCGGKAWCSYVIGFPLAAGGSLLGYYITKAVLENYKIINFHVMMACILGDIFSLVVVVVGVSKIGKTCIKAVKKGVPDGDVGVVEHEPLLER